MEIQVKYQKQILLVKIDEYATNCDSSVFLSYNNTSLLATLVIGEEEKENSFLPFTVIPIERSYVNNKMPSTFNRREGRLSEESIFLARLIDRSFRSLIKVKNREINLNLHFLSVENQNHKLFLSIFASSICLVKANLISKKNALSGTYQIYKDGKTNTNNGSNNNDLELYNQLFVVSNSENKIFNIDFNLLELEQDKLMSLISKSLEENKKLINLQNGIFKKIALNQKDLIEKEKQNNKFKQKIKDFLKDENPLNNLININVFSKKLFNDYFNNEISFSLFNSLYHEVFRANLNAFLLEKKIRLDDRNYNELRKINFELDLIPKVHGSSIFSRGKTSVLNIITLSNFDNPNTLKNNWYFHHYNFLSLSNGEINRRNSLSRREIGHGNLVEKSVIKILPNFNQFPFLIRSVSEVLSSDGSTSQASIVASYLSLISTGINQVKPIAGISIGLLENNDKNQLLVDINQLEDEYGNMDFKIAKTEQGFTSGQLDLKNEGISLEIVGNSLILASKTIDQILNKIKNVSKSSNSFFTIVFFDNKTRELIDIKTVKTKYKELILNLNYKKNTLAIYSKNKEDYDNYLKQLKQYNNIFFVNDIIEVVFLRKEKYGYFFNLFNKKDVLVHINKLLNTNSNFVVKQIYNIKITKILFNGNVEGEIVE